MLRCVSIHPFMLQTYPSPPDDVIMFSVGKPGMLTFLGLGGVGGVERFDVLLLGDRR